MDKKMEAEIEKDIEIFCQNIKKLRVAKKLSKREMARLLGIGTASLSKLESGILPKRLSARILLVIYEVFGILPSEISDAKFFPT